ncbi:hypothetical protein LY90DRAFT_498958 [Neocallimastix californiae]|uniref:Uncharacterized protein n=1 Tax=Neocallimastix californiae TaxID=1754190 RepID=A0A1Y2FPC2_9FUNG|nr:hypothetical protein LY90DRAFT_498958 [Neocallimastix californiae]|eukprot:ORY85852.1 hypothetical protein LY90DRAFT_498958 [Neocallimastix californiae]
MVDVSKIEEYFNENLSSLENLENISKLIKINKKEQENLNKEYNILVENNPKVLQEILNLSANSKEKIDNLQKEKASILLKAEQHLKSNNLGKTLEVLKRNKKEYQKLIIVQSYIQNLLDIDNLSRKVSYELSNSLTNALALYNELVNLWNKKVLKNEETNQPEIPINSYLYSTSVNIIKNLYESLKKKLTDYEEDSESIDIKRVRLAVSTLTNPIIIRFKYHFMANNLTNRLDKPSWFFSNILSTIQRHSLFLDTIVQPLFDRENIFMNTKNEFIHDLVEIIKQKLELDLPSLIQKVKEHPSYLDGYISEALQFDNILRNTYDYYPSNIRELSLVAKRDDNNNEKNEEKKETSDQLNEYQWEERYKLLPNSEQQLVFLNDIQKKIISDYAIRIKEYLNHLILADLQDESIQQFCRCLSSLNYINKTLDYWETQDFYIHLWNGEDDGLFSSSIKFNNEKIKNIEDHIVDSVANIFLASLKQYQFLKTWNFNVENNRESEMDISLEFCEPLSILVNNLNNINANLHPTIFKRICRNVCTKIENILFDKIIFINQFSYAGGLQFCVDVTKGLWDGIFRRWFKKPENQFRRLKDACILLSMDFDSPDLPEQSKKIIQILYHSKTEDVHPLDKQKWLKSLGLSGEGVELPREISTSTSKSSSLQNLYAYDNSTTSSSSSIINNLTSLANNINKFTINSNVSSESNLANQEEVNRGLNWDEAKRIVEQRLDLSINNNL